MVIGKRHFGTLFVVFMGFAIAIIVACSTALIANAQLNVVEGEVATDSAGAKYVTGEALICVKNTEAQESLNSTNSSNSLDSANSELLDSLSDDETVLNNGAESRYGFSIKQKLTTEPLSLAVEKDIVDGGDNVEKIVAEEESATKQSANSSSNSNSGNTQSLNSGEKALNSSEEEDNANASNNSQSIETAQIYLVSCGDVDNFCANIANEDSVVWAQPNYIYELDDSTKIDINEAVKIAETENTEAEIADGVKTTTDDSNEENASSADTEDATTNTSNTQVTETSNTNSLANSTANYVNNDPAYQYQWGYDGTSTGNSYSINADTAWSQTKQPTRETVVCVCDTGIDYNHPDLIDNMWTGGTASWSTALGGGTYGINTAETTTTDIMDDNEGHGTHCASAVSAVCNNSTGVCGVANNNVKLMGCKVFPKSGGAATSDIIAGYNYIVVARQNSVNVAAISCSFGTSSHYGSYDYGFNSMLVQAGKMGVVSLFSAGNSAENNDMYANKTLKSPYSVVVGSSASTGKASSFSCYGEHSVDVFAPGSNMLQCAAISTGSAQNGDYIPWVQNDSSANYYYQDFSEKPASSELEFVLYSGYKGTANTLAYEVSDGKAVISAKSAGLSAGTNNVMLRIAKSSISSDLFSSGVTPYLAARVALENCNIKSTRNYAVNIGLSSLQTGSYPDYIYPYKVYLDNTHSFATCCMPEDTNFLSISGNYIYVGLEITLDSVSDDTKIYFDDYGIGKSASNYAYMDGTSMACPVAAGVAGYVAGYMTDASTPEHALKVAAYLKGSVNKSTDLADKAKCDGVVDLNRAASGLNGTADAHNPVLQSLELTKQSEDSSTYQGTLSGYFFGSTQGSGGLTVEGASDISITSWSDNTITFTCVADKEQTSEIQVTKSDGKTGRNFFNLAADCIGYTDLPTASTQSSPLTYTDSHNWTYTSADLDLYHSATTSKALYVLYGSESAGIVVMERFDFETHVWSKVDLSNLSGYFYSAPNQNYFSMASGDDEFYFYYSGNISPYTLLSTYSETAGKFVFENIKVKDGDYGDMICNVDGELWLAGGNTYRDANVVKIYPDTGNTYEEVNDFPDGVTLSGGNMTSYGNKVVIADSTTGSGRSVFNDPYILDKSVESPTWVKGSKSLYTNPSDTTSSEYTDTNQFLCSGGVAIDTGILEVGMVVDNATTSMSDHFVEDYSSLTWNRLTNVRFSSYKCKLIVASCVGNNIYVVGKSGLDDKTRVRVMPLSTINATNDDVEKAAKRSTGTPTVSGTTVATTKIYDGTTSLNVTNVGTLSGTSGDVSLTATANFADKNVENDKAVTVTYKLTGADAYKYTTPADNTSLTASITAKSLSISSSDPTQVKSTKEYDGTNSATVTKMGTVDGVVKGDSLSITPTATYDSKTAGTTKTITVAYALSGTDMGNYTGPANSTFKNQTITQKALSISGTTVADKTYDASVDISATVGNVSGVIGEDKVTVTAAGTMTDKTAGDAKTCTVKYTIAGDDGANYSAADETTTVKVSKKNLTISGTVVEGRAYNADTAIEVKTVGNLDGVETDDTVTPAATAVLDSKDAGTRTATVTYTLNGTDAGNYNAPVKCTVEGLTISKVQTTISGTVVAEKTYDATTAATVSTIGTLAGVLPDDAGKVSVAVDSANFDSASADTTSATVKFKLEGESAVNYIVPVDSTVTSKINKKPVNVKADNKSSVKYEDLVPLTYTADKLYGEDQYTGELYTSAVKSTEGTFDIVQSTTNPVTAGDNYSVSFTKGTYTVTALQVQTIAFDSSVASGLTKTYGDDKYTAAVTGAKTDVTYASSNSDVATVTAGGEVTILKPGDTIITATAASSSGYESATASYTLKVSKRALSIDSANPTTITTRIYDATTNTPIVCGTLANIADGDKGDESKISVTVSGTYSDKKAETDKSVEVTYALTGTKAANYTAPATETVKGTIKQLQLTQGGTTAASKPYDGSTDAVVTLGTVTGVITGDTVTTTPTGQFNSKDCDTATKVNVTFALTGGDADNYIAPVGTDVAATISKKQLTITSATYAGKVYDRSTTADVTKGSLSGVVGEETVDVTASGSFADYNVDTDKVVTVTYALSGTESVTKNYTAPATQTLKANITAKPISVTANNAESVVGQPLATLTYTHDDLIEGDSFSGALETNANKDVVGSDYTITQGTLAAANYSITFTPAKYTVKDKENQTITFAGVTEGKLTKTYGDASYKEVVTGAKTAVTYSSSDTSVATVGETDGTVTILKGGTITIKAQAAEGDFYHSDEATYILTVNKKQLSVSGVYVKDKVYDKTTDAEVMISQVNGADSIDNVSVSANADFADENVGSNKDVTVTYEITEKAAEKYLAPTNETTLKGNITAAPLTISGTTADKKDYDGGLSAVVHEGTLSGVYDGDDVTVSGVGSFASKQAGTGKNVTVVYSLSGAQSGNYAAPANDTITGVAINQKQLVVTGSTADGKTYNSSVEAVVHLGTIDGKVTTDDLTVSATGKFENKNAGNGKTVTITYSISGADTGNYIAPNATTTYADIERKEIAVVADSKSSTVGSELAVLTYTKNPEPFSGDNFTGSLSSNAVKDTVGIYDISQGSLSLGNNYDIKFTGAKYNVTAKTAQTLKFADVTGGSVSKTYGDAKFAYKVSGEETTVTYTSSDESVATINSSSGEVTIKGVGTTIITATAAENEQFASATATYTLTVTAKQLGITGSIVSPKTYNAKTDATVTAGTLTGVLEGDEVSVSATGTFANANAGKDKNVTVKYTLSGNSAGKYKAPADATLTGVINPAPITVGTTTVADTKVYDGALTANVVISDIDGAISGDDVAVSASASYDNKNVGDDKTVSVKYALSGTSAANYSAPEEAEFTGKKITAAQLYVTGSTATNRTYDGSTNADITVGSVIGVIGQDDIKVSGTGVFGTKDAGSGKSVAITYAISGSDSGNYIKPAQGNATATITAKAISVVADDKSSSQGNPLLELTYTCTPALCEGDTFTGQLATTANKDVIADSPITQSTLTAGDNYAITFTGATYHVTAKTIQNLSFVGVTGGKVDKTYGDGTFTHTCEGVMTSVTYSSSQPDVCTVDSGTGDVTIKKVGSSVITATAAENDEYAAASVTYTVVVGAKQLTVSGASVKDKIYNRTTDSEIVGATLGGKVGNDVVLLTATGTFEDKNVGEGKTVTVVYTLYGSDADNYIAPAGTTLTGNITAAPLSVASSTVANKTYDGKLDAAVTVGTLSGNVNYDDVSLTAVGTFADKKVGTSKVVHVVYSVAGTDSANYSAPVPQDLSADISAASVSISGTTARDKQYDKTNEASVTIGDAVGIVSGDKASVTATGTFASVGVGVNINVAVAYSLTGSDATNYQLATTTETLKADITAKPISVVAEDKATYVGSALATLTYTCTPALCSGDAFTGALYCAANKDVVNDYAIEIGTLSAGDNYSMSFSTGVYKVTSKKVQTLQFAGVPSGEKSVEYGSAPFTELVSGAATDVTYSSTDSTEDPVASVDASSGLVTIHKPGTCYIKATAAESYEYAPSEVSYKLTVGKCSTPLVIAANSATKTYDGTPLEDSGVHVASGALADGDVVSATVVGSITKVGTAANKIDGEIKIMHDGNDVTAYYNSVSGQDGVLTVNAAPGSDVQVDTEAVKKILDKYKAMPEYKDATDISVEVETEVVIEDTDKKMIEDEVGEKSVEFYAAELWLTVDGATKNIGGENTELVTIAHKFDLVHAADMQVLRVHTESEEATNSSQTNISDANAISSVSYKVEDTEVTKTMDEIATTPNTAGEYVEYDATNGYVKVAASKYSTFGIAYNYKADPEPEPEPVVPGENVDASGTNTGSTGDATLPACVVFAILAAAAAVGVSVSRKRSF